MSRPPILRAAGAAAAAAALLVLAGPASADSTPVRLEGTLWADVGAPGLPGWGPPPNLIVEMTVPPLDPGSFGSWPSGFTLTDVPATLTVNGRPVGDTAFQAHWFAGTQSGIDFRFADVFEPDDQLQVVLFLGQANLFGGDASAPALRALDRAGSGFVYWYRPEEDGVEMMLYGRYQAGVVPEPASALLMLGGALALAGWMRRQRSALTPALPHAQA